MDATFLIQLAQFILLAAIYMQLLAMRRSNRNERSDEWWER